MSKDIDNKDLNSVEPENTDLDNVRIGETINGWIIVFAFMNILMGLSSLTTLGKVSNTEERIAKTNLEMVKIRIALEKRDNDSVQMQKRIKTVEELCNSMQKQHKAIEDRINRIENN